jgi:hypothetical protein
MDCNKKLFNILLINIVEKLNKILIRYLHLDILIKY